MDSDDTFSSSGDDDGSEQERLYWEIEDGLETSADVLGNQRFLPVDRMITLATRTNVVSAYKEANDGAGPSEEVIEFVLKRARKVFLTLIRINHIKAIDSLYKAGFDDNNLPVGKIRPENRKGRFRWEVRRLNETTNEVTYEPGYEVFNKWASETIAGFVDSQWQFLPASYSESKFSHTLHQDCPLPFLADGNTEPAEGHFSWVYKVRVHSTYAQGETFKHVFGNMQDIAVKMFRPDLKDYFYRELQTLMTIKEIDHPHLIKPIAAYERGTKRCVIFPWAGGGNLKEYWRQTNYDPPLRLQRDASLIFWALKQMRGLSEALKMLYEHNGRHGDLKPENILRFNEGDGHGRLVIADVGLTKFHVLATQRRDKKSSIMSRTLRYEAPEIDIDIDDRDKPRSRDYDPWSMGCIFLEFVIWLLYGGKELDKFNQNARDDKFWHRHGGQYCIHPDVQNWMKRISGDLVTTTSLKDVMELVEKRLLVVKLAKDVTPPEHGRATAPEAFEQMDEIFKHAELEPAYLFDSRIWNRTNGNGAPGSNLVVPQFSKRPPVPRSPSELVTKSSNETIRGDNNSPTISTDAPYGETIIPKSNPPLQTYNVPQLSKLNNVWESEPDNEFARKFIKHVDWATVKPPLSDSNLCETCTSLDIWSQVRIELVISKLRESSQICALCKLFYHSLPDLGIQNDAVKLRRDGSTLRADAGGPPIISIYVEPESDASSPAYAQIGLPQLPNPKSPEQFALLREWLRNCDESHACIPRQTGANARSMPKRLIDVGSSSEKRLRLVEMDRNSVEKYMALSHCWGKLTDEEKFCTTEENIEALKISIDYGKLTRTFRDAVDATRELNVPYLWIDSICVVQDDAKDWEVELGKMENVFSSAYCTLAASSAESSLVGFPSSRTPRTYVAVRSSTRANGTTYFAKCIDNFHQDVEAAVLNTRGWVFQERALSRRTIHFTSNQIYWECGKGVHCETLAKLKNPKAAFLGDSDFPTLALEYFRGGRIVHFQGLYEMYSRLAFTNPTDRSVALLGLEQRLARTFKMQGDYGILEGFLERSLLWRAEKPYGMKRISFPPGRGCPSWSWMAHMGAIGYLEIDFNRTDWSKEDFRNPFELGSLRRTYGERGGKGVVELAALARVLDIDRVEFSKRIILDEVDGGEANLFKCIVIGKEKGMVEREGDRTHYVLVVKPSPKGTSDDVYERVGVATLLRSQISLSPGKWTRVLYPRTFSIYAAERGALGLIY
ncbi:uncharacterized protein BCR38DRAFT_411908 [Pseudomassariella vexata]|uniref:Protein kinase domain-containing protein n=1 Tax=Pseudomassariella vexata TaxID=1141098 RepID=A0A1Y2DNE5_9PEZI|nr:uncharacterized protein BCR38DRAFT_411908 [Pseudomassariella vexata]ORY60792.1 hypothetical protein BCR38DRAFT_411908 [Pseudomassariella vexata]